MAFNLAERLEAIRSPEPDSHHRPGFGCRVLEQFRTGAIRMRVGEVFEEVHIGFPIDRGEWHKVRLQIFPDGTCGLAINGHPIGRSTDRVPLDINYRIWTEGASLDSKMLVGPLEVWTGVRTDVDWSTLTWPR